MSCELYCKILIISPGAYFWSNGLFEKIFLGGLTCIFGGGGGGGGGLYTWTNNYLHFENALIFYSSNCSFLKFSARILSLLLIFSLFKFLIMYL